MKTKLTPQEVAENLIIAKGFVLSRPELYESLQIAADDERKIANGEYAPVVHGHKIFVNNGKVETWCSNCNNIIPKYADFCPHCGALMDEYRPGNSLSGKEDSHV